MVRSVAFVALLLPSAFALTRVKEQSAVQATESMEAMENVQKDDPAALDASLLQQDAAWVLDSQTKEAGTDIDYFYEKTQALSDMQVDEEFSSHPVIGRYFGRGGAMAVVPSMEVQRELIENVFNKLSPFAKLALINIRPNATSRADVLPQLQCVGSMLKDAFHIEKNKDWYKDTADEYKTELNKNLRSPGLVFIKVETTDDKVADEVMQIAKNSAQETGLDEVRDIRAFSKPVEAYLATISDILLNVGEGASLSVGDAGKDKIIALQHRLQRSPLMYNREAKEGERCEIDGENTHRIGTGMANHFSWTNKHVATKLIPQWKQSKVQFMEKVQEAPLSVGPSMASALAMGMGFIAVVLALIIWAVMRLPKV